MVSMAIGIIIKKFITSSDHVPPDVSARYCRQASGDRWVAQLVSPVHNLLQNQNKFFIPVSLNEKKYIELYKNLNVKKFTTQSVEVDLDVKELINHAVQLNEDLIRINRYLNKFLNIYTILQYLLIKNKNLYQKRLVFF